MYVCSMCIVIFCLIAYSAFKLIDKLLALQNYWRCMCVRGEERRWHGDKTAVGGWLAMRRRACAIAYYTQNVIVIQHI